MTSEWDLVSFITGSKIRFKVLTQLNKSKDTPTKISQRLDLHISAVSRSLSELLENDLIVCLTDERKKFKIYDISKRGKEILDKIHKETNVNWN